MGAGKLLEGERESGLLLVKVGLLAAGAHSHEVVHQKHSAVVSLIRFLHHLKDAVRLVGLGDAVVIQPVMTVQPAVNTRHDIMRHKCMDAAGLFVRIQADVRRPSGLQVHRMLEPLGRCLTRIHAHVVSLVDRAEHLLREQRALSLTAPTAAHDQIAQVQPTSQLVERCKPTQDMRQLRRVSRSYISGIDESERWYKANAIHIKAQLILNNS